MSFRLATPTRAETSTWLDDLSRQQLSDGSFDDLVEDRRVTGATLSLAAFAKTLVDSDVYLAQLRELALCEVGADAGLRALTYYDARWACDILHEVYARSSGVDGRVSVDLNPRCAHDTDRMIAEANALWWTVDRPNLVIGIAASRQGLPAITACLAEGISVNATQIGSRARYADVLGALLYGAEQAHQTRRDPTAIGTLAAAGATPLLWIPPEDDIPDHGDETLPIEDDGAAMFNTAWYQVDLELGKALHNRGTTP